MRCVNRVLELAASSRVAVEMEKGFQAIWAWLAALGQGEDRYGAWLPVCGDGEKNSGYLGLAALGSGEGKCPGYLGTSAVRIWWWRRKPGYLGLVLYVVCCGVGKYMYNGYIVILLKTMGKRGTLANRKLLSYFFLERCTGTLSASILHLLLEMTFLAAFLIRLFWRLHFWSILSPRQVCKSKKDSWFFDTLNEFFQEKNLPNRTFSNFWQTKQFLQKTVKIKNFQKQS